MPVFTGIFCLNKLRKIPLLSYLIPFVFGIIVEIYLSTSSLIIPVIFIVVISLLVLVLKAKCFHSSINKSPFLLDLLLIVLFFIGGVILVQFHNKLNYANYFENYNNKQSVYNVQIIKPLRVKPKSVQCEVEIFKVVNSDSDFCVNGRALLYLEKNLKSLALLQGDKIEFKAKWIKIKPPQNPGQFNYQKYLRFHQIYSQSYLDDDSWKLINRNNYNPYTFSNKCRNYFLNLIRNSGVIDDQFAVVSALTLGYKDELSSQLKHAYSSAGAMHVLAVSGLHVGIVYGLLNFILNLLIPFKRLIVLKSIVILLCLWLYALLAGLSPSILRASTMLSFVIVGVAIKRESSIYNNIAASAFLLLFLNPFIIMQVGFQLSYLAVIGILYYQPKIYNLLTVKNYFFDKIWVITSVSLAAQIATFPVSLLYFHQFPVYFIFSNLIVIPAAFIILISALSLLVFQFCNPIYLLIGKCVNQTVYYINNVVSYIDEMPFSLVERISISVFETYLIFSLILSLTLAVKHKKLIFINASLLFILAIGVFDFVEDVNLMKKREVVIYNSGRNLAINLFFNNKHIFIADSALYHNNDAMLFNVKHHWFDLDVKKTTYFNLDDVKTIGIVNDSIPEIEFNSNNSINFDFFLRVLTSSDSIVNPHEILLMSGDKKLDYRWAANHFYLNKWIVCSNLSKKQHKLISEIAKEKNIDYFDVNNGAFIFDL